MLSFWHKFCKSYPLGKIKKLKLFKILVKNKTRLSSHSLQSNPIFWTPPSQTPPIPKSPLELGTVGLFLKELRLDLKVRF